MNFGERIYKLRTDKELSQGDLAEELEVSRQSISKWENGVSVPELDKLVKLSEIFGVSLDALVAGKEEAEQSPAQEAEPQVIYIEKPVEKRSTRLQKWSIVLCSLVCVLLLANLFLLFSKQQGNGPDQQASTNYEFMASDVISMEVEWNNGNVRFSTADTDQITISGASNETDVSIALVDGLLKILPKSNDVLSGHNLMITVPKDWICQELKLKGTSATIDFVDVSVGTLDLNGSSCTLTYHGSLEKANINGTSVTATLNCTTPVSSIRVNGNRSSLMLSIPKECGFLVNVQISSCTFHSDLSGVRYENHKYSYGNQHCKIMVRGSACDVFVAQSN